MGEWQQSTFGCFSNCGICLITYFCPCYQVGKIAEVLDDSCLLHGCFFFIPILNIIIMMSQRGQLREKQGIDGSTINDILCVLCCTLCSLTQEGVEVRAINGGMAMDIERC